MPKKSKEKCAADVRRLSKPGFYSVGGVAGLCLSVKSSGARSWILRVKIGLKRRDIGLGGFPDVTLEKARENARDIKEQINQGVDFIAERKARKAAIKAEQAKAITFQQCAIQCYRKKAHEFKSLKHSNDWLNSVEKYAYPVIGDLMIQDVELAHILKILEPIWIEKTETATRLRQRLEAIISWATISGYRRGDNPARWDNHLDAILAKPGKVKKVKHFEALPWQEIGAFMSTLRSCKGSGARGLEFLILTATRSQEIRFATWDEINLSERVWVIPLERMKSGREHRVPLSDAAITLLKSLPKFEGSPYLFPAGKQSKAMSDGGMSSVLKRLGKNVTVHGFRSSFRDWCSESTNYPREVAEMALAHTIGNAVEAAYRRGDLFEKRRSLMTAWSDFCGTIAQDMGNVLPMQKSLTRFY